MAGVNIRAADLPAAPMGWRQPSKEPRESYGPPPPPAPLKRQEARPKAVVESPWQTQNGCGELLEPSAVPPYRLWCVYAEGVDLAKLTPQQRALGSNQPEMLVGRTAQPAAVLGLRWQPFQANLKLKRDLKPSGLGHFGAG